MHRALSSAMRSRTAGMGDRRAMAARLPIRPSTASREGRERQRSDLQHCQGEPQPRSPTPRFMNGGDMVGRVTTRASTYAVRKVPAYRPVPDPPAHSGNLAACQVPARVDLCECTICAQPDAALSSNLMTRAWPPEHRDRTICAEIHAPAFCRAVTCLRVTTRCVNDRRVSSAASAEESASATARALPRRHALVSDSPIAGDPDGPSLVKATQEVRTWPQPLRVCSDAPSGTN